MATKIVREVVGADIKYPETINEAIVINHDSISTLNCLFVIFGVVVVVVGAAYYQFSMTTRLESRYSIFGFVFRGPLMFALISFVACIFLLLFLWTYYRELKRVVPSFVLLTTLGLTLWLWFDETEVQDEWLADPVLLRPSTWSTTSDSGMLLMLVLLSFLGFSSAFLTGAIRGDRWNTFSLSYAASMATAFFLALGSYYFYGLVLRTIDMSLDPEDGKTPYFETNFKRAGIYVGSIFAIFTVFVVLSRVYGYIVSFLTGTPVDYDGTIYGDETERATHRTFQTLRWAVYAIIVLPAILVWKNVRRMNYKANTSSIQIKEEWRNVGVLLVSVVGAFMFFGVLSLELRINLPGVHTVLTYILMAVYVLILGTRFIPWTEVTTTILIAFVSYFLLVFLSGRYLSLMSRTFLMAGLFIAVRIFGKLLTMIFVQRYELKIGQGIRVLAWALPLLILCIGWIARSYRNKRNVGEAILYTVFTIMYSFLYAFPSTEQKEDETSVDVQEFINDGGSMNNFAVEFILVFATLMVSLSIGRFIHNTAAGTNDALLQGRAPIAANVGVFVVYVILAVFSAYFYDYLRTSPDSVDVIRSNQEKAQNTLKITMKDVENCCFWERIGQANFV